MKVLNNKIYFELLPDSEQPQKTIFSPNMDMLKLCKVIDIGNKVFDFIKKEDIITLYVNNIQMIDKTKGFCNDKDVLFINEYPLKGKVHVTEQEKPKITPFSKAKVKKSSVDDIKDNENIYYKQGQSHILPDSTEIISETQIYFSKD